ncbi:hypothetical protein GCM10011369_18280 [Neiella marina]|uniref:Uncharacterized protein n=2 Tax=Neiella marina TaxID=508461 RepID=A0A8J2U4Y3_9GAMM|nr:hypothetical protein GCM10011369_18280 [Neiella marina]
MDLFIESIEGGRYLVATGSADNRSVFKDQRNQTKTFHSISQIKEQFADQSFGKVMLKQSTPYDEMCGMASMTGPLELEINWR